MYFNKPFWEMIDHKELLLRLLNYKDKRRNVQLFAI